MDLHVDDDAFVRAPAALVYRRLTDIGAWPTWWPGVRTDALAPTDGTEAWAVSLAPSRRTAIRVVARPGRWRHDVGFRLDLTGDVEGWAEFWLEDAFGGTVVHHILVATTDLPRPVRVLGGYRAVLRRGMWSLKDELQSAVREVAGMTP